MKIAIVGCGAAGSVFASYLKSGGDDIYMIDLNRAHMEAVAENGLLFRYPGGEKRITGFHASTDVGGIGVCDALMVVVKTTQTDSALELAAECIGPDTVVITLQNGLGNELAVNRHVPANRIIYGAGRIGTELPEPGVCVAKPNVGVNMFFGPMEECARSREVGLHIADSFRAGGLEPKYCEDVRPYVWEKAVNNMCFNTVCAVLGLKIKEVAADANGMKLVHGIMREAGDVAKALGVFEDLYGLLESKIQNTINNLGDYYPSMAQDVVLYKRQGEIDSLAGAISVYGRQVGVDTPVCDVLSTVIRAMQANYDLRYKG